MDVPCNLNPKLMFSITTGDMCLFILFIINDFCLIVYIHWLLPFSMAVPEPNTSKCRSLLVDGPKHRHPHQHHHRHKGEDNKATAKKSVSCGIVAAELCLQCHIATLQALLSGNLPTACAMIG